MFNNEETPEIQEEGQRSREVSITSDIDMDELERSLEEARSIPRTSPEGKESEDRMPYIRPLEYDESDFEDESSEQTPLSIIQEEDEEDLSESVPFPSNISRSHSASDGFESDDDVMDLLDEDHGREESAGHAMDFESVRRISQTQATSRGRPSDGMDFGKYLTNNSDQTNTDASSDTVQVEEDQVELSGLEYSEPEAERGVEKRSTPVNEYGKGMEQEEASHHPEYDQAAAPAAEQAPSNEGYAGEMAPEEQVRVFLAIYDYDPSTMSPNPDAEDEELAFNEGDLIRVRE